MDLDRWLVAKLTKFCEFINLESGTTANSKISLLLGSHNANLFRRFFFGVIHALFNDPNIRKIDRWKRKVHLGKFPIPCLAYHYRGKPQHPNKILSAI